jgi:hypothetical protein
MGYSLLRMVNVREPLVPSGSTQWINLSLETSVHPGYPRLSGALLLPSP